MLYTYPPGCGVVFRVGKQHVYRHVSIQHMDTNSRSGSTLTVEWLFLEGSVLIVCQSHVIEPMHQGRVTLSAKAIIRGMLLCICCEHSNRVHSVAIKDTQRTSDILSMLPDRACTIMEGHVKMKSFWGIIVCSVFW